MKKEDFFNCKIYTNGHGVEIFKRLISLGFICKLNTKEKAFINAPFMLIEQGIIWCSSDMDFFKKCSLKEITYAEYSNASFYPTKLSEMSKEDYQKIELFGKLVKTCEDWNKVVGYVPDWCNSEDIKYCICAIRDKMLIGTLTNTISPFYFETMESAELFLKTFKSELEKVKGLF